MILFSTLIATSRESLQSPHLGPLPLMFRFIFMDSGVLQSQSGLVAFQLRSMSKFLLDPVAWTLTLFWAKKLAASSLFLGRAPSQVILGSSQAPAALAILVEKELSVRVYSPLPSFLPLISISLSLPFPVLEILNPLNFFPLVTTFRSWPGLCSTVILYSSMSL